MSKILVTSGNINSKTFEGVCYAVQTVVGKIDAMYIFDTEQSAIQAENTQRNIKTREILGDIDVMTSITTDATLQTVIPDRMARLIKNYGVNNIVVDLSNGQKITAGVLYAVSTISRIPNIYALEITPSTPRNVKLQDLIYPQDWDYVQIQPLKEILNITQSSYVELIYYRDRIESIVSLIKPQNQTFSIDTNDRLEHSLVDYFASSIIENASERLERCVNGLGKICEDVAKIWHESCSNSGIITTQASDFNARVKQIVKQWGGYRKAASIGQLDHSDPTIAKIVLPTLAIDTLLETMIVYRNLASHSQRHYQYTKADARLALDTTLLILERIAKSDMITTWNGGINYVN